MMYKLNLNDSLRTRALCKVIQLGIGHAST